MKKLLGLGLIALTLISCGENKSEDTFGKLKGDITVLNTKDDQYFSSSINYKCEDEENCNENVVLVAIKNKKQLNTCTGALVSPSEVLVASTCFERPLEELNRACSEKIEVHSLQDKSKCNEISLHYSTSRGSHIYNIKLNSSINYKAHNVSNLSSYHIENDGDAIQKFKTCKLDFTLDLQPYSISNSSEYLNSNSCFSQKESIVYNNNELIAFSVKPKIFVNYKCISIACKKDISRNEKFLNLLNNSSNMIHKMFARYVKKSGFEDDKYYAEKINFDVNNNLLTASKVISCVKDSQDIFTTVNKTLTFDITTKSIIKISPSFKDLFNIYIKATRVYNNSAPANTRIVFNEEQEILYYKFENKEYFEPQFKLGNQYITDKDYKEITIPKCSK